MENKRNVRTAMANRSGLKKDSFLDKLWKLNSKEMKLLFEHVAELDQYLLRRYRIEGQEEMAIKWEIQMEERREHRELAYNMKVFQEVGSANFTYQEGIIQ